MTTTELESLAHVDWDKVHVLTPELFKALRENNIVVSKFEVTCSTRWFGYTHKSVDGRVELPILDILHAADPVEFILSAIKKDMLKPAQRPEMPDSINAGLQAFTRILIRKTES